MSTELRTPGGWRAVIYGGWDSPRIWSDTGSVALLQHHDSDPAIRVHRIPRTTNLDPITVFVEEHGPKASRITVQCYARAWTAYWGAHGDQRVEKFVVEADTEYVADNLTWGIQILKRHEATERKYLWRIVKTIQDHFKTL